MKPLLYEFRVLLTGIHLMRTGVVEANLPTLNKEFRLAFLEELIELKLAGPEKGRIDSDRLHHVEKEYRRLPGVLEIEAERTGLPGETGAGPALHDLLVRIRLGRRGRS